MNRTRVQNIRKNLTRERAPLMMKIRELCNVLRRLRLGFLREKIVLERSRVQACSERGRRALEKCFRPALWP